MRETLRDRFDSKIDRSELAGCWLWTSATTGRYGLFWVGGLKRNELAHRLAYMLFVGPIPNGLYVCHTCDNGHCVNPAHLFLGTAEDNNRDREAKGRSAPQDGEHNPRAKLTREAVDQIRQLRAVGMLQKEIAARFGVGREAISKVLRGERWNVEREAASVLEAV